MDRADSTKVRHAVRLRNLFALLTVVLIMIGFAPMAGARPNLIAAQPDGVYAAATVDDEWFFVERINALRADLGLVPLQVHPVLVPLAREWAEHLRAQGKLSHVADLSRGIDLEWTRLGENVGVAQAGQRQELFDAFVASPTHYANLIREDYRYVGIGVVYGSDGRIWTTHRFMALNEEPGGASTPPPTDPPATAPPGTRPSGTSPTTPVAGSGVTNPTPPTTVPSSAAPTTTGSPNPSLDPGGDAGEADGSEAAGPSRPPRARSEVGERILTKMAAELDALGL